jgi:hypothetical protein
MDLLHRVSGRRSQLRDARLGRKLGGEHGAENTVRIVGQLFNGVGLSFHVGDFTCHGRTEVGTVDYIRDLPVDRRYSMPRSRPCTTPGMGKSSPRSALGPCTTPATTTSPRPSVRRFLGESWNVDPLDDGVMTTPSTELQTVARHRPTFARSAARSRVLLWNPAAGNARLSPNGVRSIGASCPL